MLRPLSYRHLATSALRNGPKKTLPWLLKGNRASAAKGTEEKATGYGNVLSQLTAVDQSSLVSSVPFEATLNESHINALAVFGPDHMKLFKAFGIPKSIQREFDYSKADSSVIRSSTLQTIDVLKTQSQAPFRRFFFSGKAGTGKSMLLLQALAYARETGWAIVYLPSATPLVNSSTPFAYSAEDELFRQTELSHKLLQSIIAANTSVFYNLKSSKTYEGLLEQGAPLSDLKAIDGKSATQALSALFEELAAQKEVPLLVAVDDCQRLFATSDYVDPTYQKVEAFHLSVPRALLDLINGATANGAALFAPSTDQLSHSPALKSYWNAHTHDIKPSSLKGRIENSIYKDVGTEIDAYRAIVSNFEWIDAASNLSTHAELKSFFDDVKNWRVSSRSLSDDAVLEFFVSADGNPRHFKKALMDSQIV